MSDLVGNPDDRFSRVPAQCYKEVEVYYDWCSKKAGFLMKLQVRGSRDGVMVMCNGNAL